MASTAFACMHLFVFNGKKRRRRRTKCKKRSEKKQANEKTFLWPLLLLHIEQRQAEKHVCARRYINDDNGINNFFLLHINTTCESCCWCRRCRGLMLLHILYILNTKEENEDHFHSLCVCCCRCRLSPYFVPLWRLWTAFTFYIGITYKHTLGTHSVPILCMHTMSVSTQYFSPRISFFIFFCFLCSTTDSMCAHVIPFDGSIRHKNEKNSDDDETQKKNIELNWNWSAHIIMCAYRRHRCTIAGERFECV